ncbi:DUF4064 domain-containing protein [Oceanobacillus sojae]|uniref:DUF4064 domain-containing protein n=1 Tax=Oceanobacillus sojae TaxID=582851 RepID=A0A511ZH87_9BACI|nr:DUF4064 domain-containing protein [Oceanobacillus sojae]GEN86807.1 hypothetical protein OSO01_15460 [Oceanobacillus sojae]
MRTGEVKYNISIIFIIIAILSYGLLAMNSYSMLGDLDSDKEFREEVEDRLQSTGDELGGVTQEEQIEIFSNSVTFVIIVAIISILLGITAAVFLGKRIRVKLIGILLIVLGILSTILTLGLGIIGGIGYLIAGVMTVVKQRKAGHGII